MVSSLGGLGVSFFFMISGYLITRLLIAEEGKRGRVNLVAFYIRRVFRIMPAFYVYVIAIFLLGRFGLIATDDEAVLRSSVFICNFSDFSCSWWLAHTWSLVVEEQFYLIWPILFVIVPARRQRLAIFLMLCLVAGSILLEPLRGFIYIMTGGMVALSTTLREQFAKISQIWLWLLSCFLLTLSAAPQSVSPFVPAFQPILVAGILFESLFGPSGGLMQQILQCQIFTRIGLILYSLYLWQQLSLAPAIWGGRPTGADEFYALGNLTLALIFIPIAIASYFLIEKPMISIGHRLSGAVQNSWAINDKNPVEGCK